MSWSSTGAQPSFMTKFSSWAQGNNTLVVTERLVFVAGTNKVESFGDFVWTPLAPCESILALGVNNIDDGVYCNTSMFIPAMSSDSLS
eukprot:09914_6